MLTDAELKTFVTGCAVCAALGLLLIVGLFWFVPLWALPFAPRP